VYFDEDWELNGETPMDVLKSFRDDEPESVVQQASDEAVELLSRNLEGSSSKRSWTGSGSSTTRRPTASLTGNGSSRWPRSSGPTGRRTVGAASRTAAQNTCFARKPDALLWW
jgi:hypothetical protein